MKKGRLSNAEARYITENVNKIPVEDIATYLDRDPSSIESFIKKKLKIGICGEHGGDPKAIAAGRGFKAMESDELETLVDQLIVDHPDEWSRFVGGDDGDGGVAGVRAFDGR